MANRLNPYGPGSDLIGLLRLLDAVEAAEAVTRADSARARKITEAIIVDRAQELYDILCSKKEAEEEGAEEE